MEIMPLLGLVLAAFCVAATATTVEGSQKVDLSVGLNVKVAVKVNLDLCYHDIKVYFGLGATGLLCPLQTTTTCQTVTTTMVVANLVYVHEAIIGVKAKLRLTEEEYGNMSSSTVAVPIVCCLLRWRESRGNCGAGKWSRGCLAGASWWLAGGGSCLDGAGVPFVGAGVPSVGAGGPLEAPLDPARDTTHPLRAPACQLRVMIGGAPSIAVESWQRSPQMTTMPLATVPTSALGVASSFVSTLLPLTPFQHQPGVRQAPVPTLRCPSRGSNISLRCGKQQCRHSGAHHAVPNSALGVARDSAGTPVRTRVPPATDQSSAGCAKEQCWHRNFCCHAGVRTAFATAGPNAHLLAPEP